MRKLKLLLLLLLALLPNRAEAGCSVGAVPFNLQNNTTADATQVMANFNQIVNGAQSNCAAAGANNDITSLGALATPISPAQGGTTVFAGGISTGVNALTISTTPSFSLTTGFRVSFIAGAVNTAATTANVSGTGVRNVFRKTQLGALATAGGELINGNVYQMVYDGTEYVLDGETIMIGKMSTFAGGTVPPGHLLADGTTYNQSTFPGLFTVIGTTYGGGVGTFNVPDTRGRVLTGLDSYGSAIGAAGRLTSAGTGCGTTFNSLGVTCANSSQSHTQIGAEIAVHNHGITDLGHNHNAPSGAFWWQSAPNAAGFTTSNPGGPINPTSGPDTTATTGITINNSGSSQPMPIVPNNLGQLMIIRF
jgi:microcystin-dependent protein